MEPDPKSMLGYIDALPQDDTKKSVAKYLDTLSVGEKRWHTKGMGT